MRILIDIGHPAHVHFFKNLIWLLEKQGHHILVTATDKEVTCQLLDNYGFEFINLGKPGRGLLSKVFHAFVFDFRMWGIVWKFNPDIVLGIASIRGPHVAFLCGKKSINFDDTEHSKFEISAYLPFVTKVFTPACFQKDLGCKQVRYPGYHELAYLHPQRFAPDRSVLDEIGVKAGEPFFIIRFVSWGAVHDIGQHGFQDQDKADLVEYLSSRGKVLITSEAQLPDALKKFQITVNPAKIHHLLYYATLYIGEGATMASEAAVLGTPAIYINTLKLGYVEEQAREYGLSFVFTDSGGVLAKVKELLSQGHLKQEWQMKKEMMLKEREDTTDMMMKTIEEFSKEADA